MSQTTVIAWREKRPPLRHWVMASYGVLEPLRLTRICKHGCCVDQGFGSMVLPLYWRDATADEIAKDSWIKSTAFPPQGASENERSHMELNPEFFGSGDGRP